MEQKEIIKKFSFKQFANYMKQKNEENNIKTIIPSRLPNKNYIYNIVKNQENQTLYDILTGIGWNEEITNESRYQIGKFIGLVLPHRKFENVINDYNMKVRIYKWFEVPFIVSIIYSYFDLLEFIPSHWLYAFYQETNIAYIVYNLVRSNIQLNNELKIKLTNLSHNRSELHYLEEYIYQKSPLFIDKKNCFKDYYLINAKYGLAIELIILQYLQQKNN